MTTRYYIYHDRRFGHRIFKGHSFDNVANYLIKTIYNVELRCPDRDRTSLCIHERGTTGTRLSNFIKDRYIEVKHRYLGDKTSLRSDSNFRSIHKRGTTGITRLSNDIIHVNSNKLEKIFILECSQCNESSDYPPTNWIQSIYFIYSAKSESVLAALVSKKYKYMIQCKLKIFNQSKIINATPPIKINKKYYDIIIKSTLLKSNCRFKFY